MGMSGNDLNIAEAETLRLQAGDGRWTKAVGDIITAIETLGSAFDADLRKLTGLQDRFSGGRFHLAVLGQFKRGKSTLLNALLGEALVPSGLAPVTAIPTMISAGQGYRISVRFARGQSKESSSETAEEACAILRKFISEDENPRNHLGISVVEATSPSPLLAHGVVLIDTPGIGSTFRHNSLMTFSFLPECDAALFIVSADPPITETEVSFLSEVMKRVKRIFFVMNKADYLSAQERDEAVAFLRRALAQEARLGEEASLFVVSARDGCRAVAEHDEAALAASGIASLRDHISLFLSREKNEALRQALSAKVSDCAKNVCLRTALMIRSSLMPLQDLESRLSAFNSYVQEAERERQLVRDAVAGDQHRTLDFFEDYCRKLRQKAVDAFSKKAQALLKEAGAARDISDSVGAAVPQFFENEMSEATQVLGQKISAMVIVHSQRSAQLLEGIRDAASRIFEIPHRSRQSSMPLELKRRPFWVTRPWNTVPSAVPDSVVDRLVPSGMRARRIRHRVAERVDELVTRNVENLRWSLVQSIRDGFARISAELDGDLDGEIRAIRSAIDLVLERRRQSEASVGAHTQRLQQSQGRLEDAISRFEELA